MVSCKLFILVGRMGVRICLILSDSTKRKISSLPVDRNNFRTFSVSFPALKVFCSKQTVYC